MQAKTRRRASCLRLTRSHLLTGCSNWIALCILGLLPSAARGLEPSHKLSQYAHTAWRLQDGFVGGVPSDFAQTPDGYIWIATDAGPMRFDGLDFTPFQGPQGESLPPLQTFSLLSAKDGSLWLGTVNSLQKWKDGHLTTYKSRGRVNAIVQGADGEIWISRSRTGDDDGGLCRVDGLNLQCYGLPSGMPIKNGGALVQGADGNLWLTTANEVVKWKGGRSLTFAPPGIQSRVGLGGFTSLAKSPDGSLWAGMDQPGPGLGLQRIVNDAWKAVLLPGFDGSKLSVTALFVDRRGAVWIGTADQGIYRIYEGKADHFRATGGLSSDTVWVVFEDREGNIWIGTSRGIDELRDLSVVSFSAEQGLTTASAESVLATREGPIWIGGGGLDVIQKEDSPLIEKIKTLPGFQITSMLEDHRGRVWVGVDNRLYVYAKGKYTPMKGPEGMSIGPIVDLKEDSGGAIWVLAAGKASGLIEFPPSAVAIRVTTSEVGKVNSLLADPNGGIWLALSKGGLAHYRDGQFLAPQIDNAKNTGKVIQLAMTADGVVLGSTPNGVIGSKNGKTRTLGIENGLPCVNSYSLTVDTQKSLWISAACGLLSITDSELRRWWDQPDAKLNIQVFDALDGFSASRPVFSPKASVATDGKIWFATSGDLQQIDPLHLPRNTLVPPVDIQRLIADRKEFSTTSGPRLPPLTRELEIDYTALSFTIPKRVRFRYKLDGFESQWHDAGTRRQAFYTNLRPGPYRFHVIACNNDGLWNDAGATIAFSIAPTYFETVWFQLLCAGILVCLLWIGYLSRLRYATAQIQQRLGTTMEERERIARELHDTLLQGVQGLMLRFQGLMKKLPEHEPVRQMMGQVLDRADEVLLEGRQRVRDLRAEATPMDDLVERLKRCAEELAQDYPIAFNLVVAGVPQALEPTISNEVYQIAREALTNAFQHSYGARVEAKIAYDNAGLRVVIRDDGRGIEEKILDHGRPGHWGVAGMRERGQKIGAKLHIHSHADKGTEIDLAIPARLAYRRTPQSSVWTKIRKAIGN